MKTYIKIIVAMLIYGSIGVFVEYAGLPSSVIAAFRGIIGVLFLITANAFSGKKFSFSAVRKNLLLLLFSGAAIGANWVFLFEAYNYTSKATATLAYYFAPIFIIVLSPLVLKEKLTATKFFCIVFSLVGMVFVADIFSAPIDGKNNLLGIGLGLVAAMLYAAVILMNKHLKDISPMELTISQLAAACLVLIPYTLAVNDITALHFDVKAVVLVIIIGVVHTGIAYLLYFSAVQKLSAQSSAIFSYIDPVTAIFLSAFILHEELSFWKIIGAVLILGSTLVSELTSKKQKLQ